MQSSILVYISDTNHNLTERALNSITAADLASGTLQIALVQKLLETNYSTQKLLVNKLSEASSLTENVRKELAKNLSSFNGQLVSDVLDLFLRHNITDAETCRFVSDLLQVKNSFISKKAYTFLKQANSQDAGVQKRLSQYKTENNLTGVE